MTRTWKGRLGGLLETSSVNQDIRLTALLKAELETRWPVAASADQINDIVRYALLPVGKLVRPLLLLHSALAVGGQLDRVLPAAVGLECAHVGSLVHDDIIDDDGLRRSRASMHERFGPGAAIVAGNALFFAWFEALSECTARGVPDARVLAAVGVQARAGRLVCQGAAAELAMAGKPATSVEAYLKMARLKTAVLISAACRIGATLAGAAPSDCEALTGFGEALGMGFQIRDDLLPYTAYPNATGKPGDSDLRNQRPTLPVLLARERATADQRTRLFQAFAKPAGEAVEEIRGLVVATAAHTAAAEIADRYADQALGHLACLPDTAHRRYLEAWARDPTGPLSVPAAERNLLEEQTTW